MRNTYLPYIKRRFGGQALNVGLSMHYSNGMMGGDSLVKLVGQKVIFADGFCENIVKIGHFDEDNPLKPAL